MTQTTRASRSTVAGLDVQQWQGGGSGAPVVLGLNGLGATARMWTQLAESLPDAHVVAPDLSGRGFSVDVRRPAGMAAHATDCAAVAEELDLRDVVVVGHSMGAYLAPQVAAALGDRCARVVLVDGGLPADLPFFFTPWLVRTMFRSQIARSSRKSWPDARALVVDALGEGTKGRKKKAFDGRPDLVAAVSGWFEVDLVGAPGDLRVRTDAAHCADDAVDCYFGPETTPALERLTVPTHLVAAEGAKVDGSKPLLNQRTVDAYVAKMPNLTAERRPGNHVTVLFDPAVARAVAGSVRG